MSHIISLIVFYGFLVVGGSALIWYALDSLKEK